MASNTPSNKIGLIVSNSSDRSTSTVISFLNELSDISIVRSNEDEYSDKDFRELWHRLNTRNSFHFIWLRRGNFPEAMTVNPKFYGEVNALRRHMHRLAESQEVCLGSLVKEYDHNKLNDLRIAEELGIKIPATFIAFNKEDALDILNANSEIEFITKALNDPVRIKIEDSALYGGFASLVRKEDLKDVQFLVPSLLQENIKKKFEIRSFYISGVFFSMAIFSQNDIQTKIDFRHYNLSKPNRNVPFKLPINLQEKLRNLMQALDLNSGSIDLIYSIENEFVFLEVNPCGQYRWLSENCNYYIDEYIAKELYNEKN